MSEPTLGSPVNGGRVTFRRVGLRSFKPRDIPVIKSHTTLPAPERWFYFVCWVAGVIYTCFKVYDASLDKDEMLNDYDFSSGWSWLGRKKDISNFEWTFWSSWEIHMWPWVLGHVLVGQAIRWSHRLYMMRSAVFLVYSLVACCFLITPLATLMLLGHGLLIYVVSLTSSAMCIWVTSLLLLSTLNFHPGTYIIRIVAGDDPYDTIYYLTMFTTAMFQLRYTSAALDMATARKAQRQALESAKDDTSKTAFNYSFFDMLSYCFYFPLFFCGPVIPFEEFQGQFHQPMPEWTMDRFLGIIKDTLRMAFWALFIEFSLHFFYFNSMQRNLYMMSTMSLWALAGLVYCQGQFFQVKYVVMFGLPRNIARFDFIEPPLGPKCISRIYLYSQMWKYFDRGLYAFIKKHIYIPLGGSQAGLFWQFFGSACSFLFIFYWHGAEDFLGLWSLLNFIGITCEVIGRRVASLPKFQQYENDYLSPAMSRRFRAFLVVPFFIMSIFAIFVFFAGIDSGQTFLNRLIYNGWPVPICTGYFFLYCCVQTAMEIEKWEFRRNNYKHE